MGTDEAQVDFSNRLRGENIEYSGKNKVEMLFKITTKSYKPHEHF
jgi:hypothetical protein